MRVTGRPEIMATLFCYNKNKPIHSVLQKEKKKGTVGDNGEINIVSFCYSMSKLLPSFKAGKPRLCV